MNNLKSGQKQKRLWYLLLVLFGMVTAILQAADVQRTPILFYHESYGTPELKRLLAAYDFDERVVAGQNEYEQMLLLKDWVFYHIPFNRNYPKGDMKNTLKILKQAGEGENFHCVHFATAYMQCAISLGWTARYLFVHNIKAELHATNEIWSNQYKKWIMIDVTWNVHIEKAGIPLSLYEIRQEWQKNNGQDLIYVFGAGPTEKRYTYRDLPIKRTDNNAWKWWPIDEIFMTYTYGIALVARNDFFSAGNGDGSVIYDYMYNIKDSLNENDKKWSFRLVQDMDDLSAFYHDLNRVDIDYTHVNWNTVRIKLDAFGSYNYTPNFKSFLIKRNNEEWVSQEQAVFFWKPAAGENQLQVRIVNKFGVKGPVSTLTLRN